MIFVRGKHAVTFLSIFDETGGDETTLPVF
jgi:hypothetical protein